MIASVTRFDESLEDNEESETPEKRAAREEAEAFHLSGKAWHTLSTEDTSLAIYHQHVTRLLHPAVRAPGMCLVGPVAIPA